MSEKIIAAVNAIRRSKSFSAIAAVHAVAPHIASTLGIRTESGEVPNATIQTCMKR
jgi:hypothetical protein